jgi:hypothetical protein
MLDHQIQKVDLLETAGEVRIPVYFFLGKYDFVTPTSPVVDYFNRLCAPR